MVEDLLAAGVKKEDLPKKPMHWTKRKKPWDEEEEDLEVLDAKGGYALRGIAALPWTPMTKRATLNECVWNVNSAIFCFLP